MEDFLKGSTPSSFRAVSQGIMLTSSSKSWKSAFLKFGSPTLLLIYIQCMITASILMSPMSSLALVTKGSSNNPPLVDLSITWVKKMSHMHSRSLQGCLWLALPLFQQILGWLECLSKTKGQKPWAQCLLLAGARCLCQQAPLNVAAYSGHQVIEFRYFCVAGATDILFIVLYDCT